MSAATTQDLWQRLYVPTPPDTPACQGASPHLFDLYPGTSSITGVRHGDRYITSPNAMQVSTALGYCAACPVQQWCEDAVQPARGYYSGIAAGAVWVNGRRVWTVADQLRAEERARRAAA